MSNFIKKQSSVVRPASFYRIMQATGRKPNNCKCMKCKQQCHTPCLGTPQDIKRLMDSGYTDRLAITYWGAGIMMGITDMTIVMVQPILYGDWCIFYNGGLCELHGMGLKPTEGRLSSHLIRCDNFRPRKSISWNVAKEWIDPANADLVKSIFEIINGNQ